VIPWLADVLRDGGLTVVEHDGWKTHKRPGTWNPVCGIVHATAAPTWQSDDVQIGIVRNGRSDLVGPIANATVDRLGRWHVLSAGRCNTTLEGTAGRFRGIGNTGALGVEACNDNRGEPWPAQQYESYARGWAAICRRLGWRPERLAGHKEHTPGHKTDPTFDMDIFRDRVGYYLDGGDDMALSDDDRLLLKQTRAAVLGMRWLWGKDRAEFLSAGGDPKVWDFGGGLGPNKLAEKLATVGQFTDEQVQAIGDRVDVATRETLTAMLPSIVEALRQSTVDDTALTMEDVRSVMDAVIEERLNGATLRTVGH
jgi:hypothetical protein